MRIALSTHHKAGTHWTKYVLSNYINLDLFGAEKERVTYDSMEKNFFPLRLDRGGFRTHPLGSELQDRYGITEVYWAHETERVNRSISDVDKVSFQCRNLLDFLVSKFHYDFKRLNSGAPNATSLKVSRPYDLHPQTTRRWCKIVTRMNELAEKWPAQFRLFEYEDLKSNSVERFSEMITFLLDEKPRQEFVVKAVERSTIDLTRRDEQYRGAPIVGHTYSLSPDGAVKSASFARSGEIGQYKNYFSREELGLMVDLATKMVPPKLHHLIVPEDI